MDLYGVDAMPPDRTRTAEALLSQSDWVRVLVRGLGVDESGTEDVLQSTWIAALANPPRTAGEGASFRAWIGRVARNFALRRIDRDARRAGRERDSAKEERLPSAADVVEREEARAEVVRALLDVHEPYRTALLLRFYEGLEPRDIARLQSVPASTVRNRLKRGLALLKERLEVSQGPSWRQRCLLVLPALHAKPLTVPPATYPSAAAAASGGALVIKSLGFAAAVALAAGGAYLAVHRTAPSRGPSAEVVSARSSAGFPASGTGSAPAPTRPSAGPRAKLSRADSQLVAAAPASTRAPAAEASETTASAEDDGIRCTIRGKLLEPDGSPLALAGSHALRSRSILSKKERELAEVESTAQLFDLTTGVEMTRPFAPEAVTGDLAVVVRDAGNPDTAGLEEKVRVERELTSARMSAVLMDKVKVAFTPVFTRPAHVLIASAGGDARELDADAQGRFQFGDLRPDRWRLVATAPGHQTKRMEFEIRRGETEKPLDLALESASTLRVKLVTPEGQDLVDAVTKELGDRFAPVPFATRTPPGPCVQGLDAGAGGFGSGTWRGRHELDEATAGDASGVLELSDPLPLHVGIAACEIVLEERQVSPGAQEVVFVVPLDRFRALVSGARVQIVSAVDGRPIAGASARIGEFAGAVAGADGFAELRGIPPGWHEIRLSADATERCSEWVRIAPGVQKELGVRELGPTVPIRGRVVDEVGAPVVANVQLRSLDARSEGRELPLCDSAVAGADGLFSFENGGKRRYAVFLDSEEWAAAIVTVDASHGRLEEIVVHASRASELKLTFPIEPGPGATYVIETGDGIPVSVQPADGWQPLSAWVGNGNYCVRLVDGGKTLWTRHVIVQPGQMMAFDRNPGPR